MTENTVVIKCSVVFTVSLSSTVLEERSDNFVPAEVPLPGKLLRRIQRQENISMVSRPSHTTNVY